MKKLIIFDYYRTLYNPETGRLFSGIKRLLYKLFLNSENTLILITTFNLKRKKQIKSLNLNKYFKEIILCKQKELIIYKDIMNKYPSNAVVVIGDREEEEIKIGKKLNVKTIHVNPNFENPYSTIKKQLKNV